ncbi:ChaN family lipoprotein [Variovorax defluvii]|uniref:ChaN family lipoprotein n=1 Tax=Variovorax defluvii TaxID=913761 RepID=A0ABP8IF20_9BURK
MPRRPPRLHAGLSLSLMLALLAGCAGFAPMGADTPIPRRVLSLLPADALLLGEQHDAAEHQDIERQAVETLAARGRLAALAIEMAEEGHSTVLMDPASTEAQVQEALGWNDKAWPWAAYGPAVMAAVRAGVPVLGANLPRARMRDAMADVSLDAQLGAEAHKAQQEAVRSGHCDLLPESQIRPMTRIQIARDRAMAQTILQARVPGKTVVLLSGAGHSAKGLGVPQHLPSDLAVKTVQLQAGAPSGAPREPGAFDAVWQTPALPEKDYCAALRAQAEPKR